MRESVKERERERERERVRESEIEKYSIATSIKTQ